MKILMFNVVKKEKARVQNGTKGDRPNDFKVVVPFIKM